MVAQVFISYAHADNQAFDEEMKGWVTIFVDNLQKAIGMKPGGGQVDCWMDHRLEPQRSVDDALRRRIRESACIVAFMSPRYLESEWCQLEMDTFVKLVGGGGANDRVFLVEVLETDRNAWHPGIRSITVVKFWHKGIDQPEPMALGWPVPNPKSDRAYWRELNRLASILARQIRVLLAKPPVSSLRVMINADKPDRDLGKQAQGILGGLEIDATLAAEPLSTQLPAEYRQQLEALLDNSHGVIIVYGAAPPSWVQVQHSLVCKVLALRRKDVWEALLDGPPAEKPDHGLPDRNLMVLDCRYGLSSDPLKRFVEKLRAGADHV